MRLAGGFAVLITCCTGPVSALAASGCHDTAWDLKGAHAAFSHGSEFTRDLGGQRDYYQFQIISRGSWDPEFPGRACFQYQIQQIASSSSKDAIQQFRWPDIGLPFTDVTPFPPTKTYRDRITHLDSAAYVPTEVEAFENSKAITLAVLPLEVAAINSTKFPGGPFKTIKLNASDDFFQDRSGGGGIEFAEYRAREQFPSTTSALDNADIPLAPVFAVPNYLAQQSALNSGLAQGKTSLSVTALVSPEVYDTDRGKDAVYVLRTEIAVHSADDSEIQIYAPSLREKPLRVDGPVSPGSIMDFVRDIKESKNVKRSVYKGVFVSTTVVKNTKERNPAYFIVDYPVTVATKQGSSCIIVSGFSAFPISLDQKYCKK